jgi:hypothetical protein
MERKGMRRKFKGKEGNEVQGKEGMTRIKKCRKGKRRIRRKRGMIRVRRRNGKEEDEDNKVEEEDRGRVL